MHFMHCPQRELTAVEHNARSVNALNPDSVGFTELDNGPHSAISTLRRILYNYRVCAAPPGATHSQEVPIALRTRGSLTARLTRYQSTQSEQISPDVPGPGVGNDRHYTVVRFRRPRFAAAHLATHTNAAIQGPRGHVLDNERTKVTARAMREIESTIHALILEGREVVVTGDFNYRTHKTPGFVYWEFSPQAMFKRLHMKYHEEGLDYLAYTPGLRLHSPVRVIPVSSSLNQSDHPWLIADLRYRRTRA
jgi:hypothetical protein